MSKVILNNITVDLPHPTRRKIIELSDIVEAAAKPQSDIVLDYDLLNAYVFEIAAEIFAATVEEKSDLEVSLIQTYLDDTNCGDIAAELIGQIRPDAYDPIIKHVLGRRE